MQLLDTPEWNSLTTAEKRIVGSVYGNDGPLTTVLSTGARKAVEVLESRGLITVTWNERNAVIGLREAGWTNLTAVSEPIRTSDGAEVKPLLYIQDSRALYKVSTVYASFITVTVCFDRDGQAPNRTSVRRLTPEQVAGMPVASNQIVSKYHAYLDKR